jgi:DNA repair photolyase
MPLTKSAGNMYSWVTHTHTHLGGKCLHECSYCYVGKSRFGVIPRYEGELRLIEKEFEVNYGSDKTIFMEHMNDAFADGVKSLFIDRILSHCCAFPLNTYVFQSKNPERFLEYIKLFPKKTILGTTIETNREISISKAPSPVERFSAMQRIRKLCPMAKLFITIEPIMALDVNLFVLLLRTIEPDFINIGADSKKCNLPEPSKQDVQNLIKSIQDAGLNIRIKNNLGRFLDV